MTATVLFDLDGTLIDSAPDVCRALNRILVPIGRSAHTLEEVKAYLGQGARVLMEMALRHTGDVPAAEHIETLTAEFLGDYAANPVVDSVVYPGVFEALDELKSKDFKLAICTNKPSSTAGPVIDFFSLAPYFDAIVCADHVTNRKPHGDHIRETISAVNGSMAEVVMVGDSENDISAAINAGIPSIVVSYGYAHIPHHELGADLVIDHFDELNTHIFCLLA